MILAFGYHSFKDYFVLHYSKKEMFLVIFDQFYFHEKVAWCCHKTCSMLGNHICTSLKITILICVFLLACKCRSSVLHTATK